MKWQHLIDGKNRNDLRWTITPLSWIDKTCTKPFNEKDLNACLFNCQFCRCFYPQSSSECLVTLNRRDGCQTTLLRSWFTWCQIKHLEGCVNVGKTNSVNQWQNIASSLLCFHLPFATVHSTSTMSTGEWTCGLKGPWNDNQCYYKGNITKNVVLLIGI